MRSQLPKINITDELTLVLRDICHKTAAFAHINPRQVKLYISFARNSSRNGIYAKIVPMRFPDGSNIKLHKGKQYGLPQILTFDGEILYLIYIYFPRFFSQPFEQRLLTLIHELYHISPEFDGTIRQIGNGAHGASRKQYNDHLQPMLDDYLTQLPDEKMLYLIKADLPSLMVNANLMGNKMAMPKATLIK